MFTAADLAIFLLNKLSAFFKNQTCLFSCVGGETVTCSRMLKDLHSKEECCMVRGLWSVDFIFARVTFS